MKGITEDMRFPFLFCFPCLKFGKNHTSGFMLGCRRFVHPDCLWYHHTSTANVCVNNVFDEKLIMF